MKPLISILLLCPVFSFAAQTVYVDYNVAFECKNVSLTEARRDLAAQCSSQGMALSRIQVTSCVPSGSDGGYVNYFAVTVIGDCK